MTQKIFKKSNKEDMKLLFSIMPDWCNYISSTFIKGTINIFRKKPKFKKNSFGWAWIQNDNKFSDNTYLINIDFETENPEEMIIRRKDYE